MLEAWKTPKFPNRNHVPCQLTPALGCVTQGEEVVAIASSQKSHLPKVYHSNSILNFPAADFGGRGENTGGNKSTTAVVPQAPGLRNVLGDRRAHPVFSIIRNNIWRVGVRAAFLCLPCFCSRYK